LFMEIEHFIFIYRKALEGWNLDDPDMLEVSYEALMGPQKREIYARIFTHLGFFGRGLALAGDLMTLFEAESRSGARTGAAGGQSHSGSHIRSGRSGQWQDELEADHLAYIEQELGPVLRKFGY